MIAIIYQLKINNNTRSKRFEPLSSLGDNSINLNDYDKVAILSKDDIEAQDESLTLEEIFKYGNTNKFHEENKEARSISVSDLIKLDDEFFYVDPYGFENVTSRITTETENNDLDIYKMAKEIERQTGMIMDIKEVYSDAGAGLKHLNICPRDIDVQLLPPGITAELSNGTIDKETFDKAIINAVNFINKHGKKQENLIETFESDLENTEAGLKEQLLKLGMSESQADITVKAIVAIMKDAMNPITESFNNYKDKLSIEYMGKVFNQMRKDGWDGDTKTAEKYFDNVMKQIDPNFKDEKEEPLREAVENEDNLDDQAISEEDNSAEDGISNKEDNLDNNAPTENDEDKTILDYLQDRIGQTISVGEFNSIMQSIFGRYNELFLQVSDIYNMDPSQPQEITIWDDADEYDITFSIVDELTPSIQITDVDMI